MFVNAIAQTADTSADTFADPALAKGNPVVADLMTPPVGVFPAETTVVAATAALREQVRSAFITYLYITAPDGRLLGLIAMREMLLARPDEELEALMLRDVFTLNRDTRLDDALREVLNRHFPVYPVVDGAGRLVGLVRGADLFANRAIEISAQAGSMVGVEKEERLSTPLRRSLLLRHPWLQVNLLTAFLAAGVVSLFEGTLSRLVILAVFLPVMSGQTGNTGCQALAVALRGMTLGDIKAGNERALMLKEASLGFFNGVLVGITAGAGLFVYAWMQGEPSPLRFGLVALAAMTIACTISGIAGVVIPLVLKRFGADPATASSIFLTTARDIASMGIFLSLASVAL